MTAPATPDISVAISSKKGHSGTHAFVPVNKQKSNLPILSRDQTRESCAAMKVLVGFLLLCVVYSTAKPLPPACLKVDDILSGKRDPLEGDWVAATDNPTPKFSWCLQHSERNAHQTGFRIRVYSKADFNELVWDSGKLKSNLQHVNYKGEWPLRSGRTYYWTVTWWDHNDDWADSMETGCFIMGLLNDEWNNAMWITARSVTNAPYMRKEFSLSYPITSANLYVSGLGWYQLSINGHDVQSRNPDSYETIALTPGWSQYEIRVPYVVYSVHHLLIDRNASNVIGVILGDGWHDLSIFPNQDFPNAKEDKLLLRCMLEITDNDGSNHYIVSDESWQVAPSPIVSDGVYNGETFNASMIQMDWNKPNFDASEWKKADKAMAPAGNMSLFPAPDIIEVEVHEPIHVYKLQDTQVVDFGTNAAGVCALKVSNLPPNAVVELRHAEVPLHQPYGPANGSLYYDNLRSAKATDIYIASGSSDRENEIYQPSFTYHGFRYAQIKGYSDGLNSSNIVRKKVHSNVKLNGKLNTSSDIINAIQSIVVNGQSSNMMSIPTDCPQRDERLGWMGDAGLSADSMALNFDTSAFHLHYLQLINDELQNGTIPDVVPFFRYGGRPADPAWSSAFPHIVWVMYKYYGDLDTAKKYLPSVMDYFMYMVSRISTDSGFADYFGRYGDWVPPPPQKKVALAFTSSFSLLMDMKLILEVAEVLNDTNTANSIKTLLDKLNGLFNSAFLKDSKYLDGTEITYSLPLALDIVPSDIKSDFISDWLKVIEDNKYHVASGIIGTKFLFPSLSSNNKTDIGMRIAQQMDYPSWGYMIGNQFEPATTVWELWNAWEAGPGMNSRNHHMFSSISGWLRTELVGLTMPHGSHAYSTVDLYPARILDLTYASVAQEWPKNISLSWERVGGLQCIKSVALNTESEHHPLLKDHAKITCSENAIIKRIDFASFGTPDGTCGNYAVNDACHHPDSMDYIRDMCIGKAECNVPLWIEKWGDPCPNVEVKWLQVQAQCDDTANVYHTLKVDTVIPVNSQANLHIPTYNQEVTIREGDSFIWNGLEDGKVEIDGIRVTQVSSDNIKLRFGSGFYSFRVTGKH